MRGRVGGMHLHPAFNRRFRNPFTSLASWQIEDCARAMQCYLPVLFRPARSGQRELALLTPVVAKKAFGHLKRFLAFHLGHVEYETRAEYTAAAKEAADELLHYGTLMEQVRSIQVPLPVGVMGCSDTHRCARVAARSLKA